MMSSPGNPLEVTSAQCELNRGCGAKVSSPSRPQEASPSPGAQAPWCCPDKRADVLGGVGKALTCSAQGQAGYVRLVLAAPRRLPEGPQAVG